MIISYNWLKTLINFDLTPDKLSELLTDTGLEVEKLHKIESIKGGLAGLVVGEVLTCEKAENADNLNLTTVNIGQPENLSIVCGAPNVAAGQKVIIATVGTTIYPTNGEPFKIKKAKIRGYVSMGMICAEDEIGLGQSHDGILILPPESIPGTPLSEVFKLNDDYQIEIGLTPNRGDATSHLGTARDVKAITGNEICMPEVVEISNTESCPITVEVEDASDCPRYTSILLENITVKESPDWLKQRLQSIDLKPINNVVDTTNYVLHEIGQPIHAFDAAKINQKIIVRKSKPGETITTLDEVERKLNGEELLICDKSKPLAIAGVFGGFDSGVSDSTTSVFIESAYFNPATVRKSAKIHGLNTDASFRYERGCDPTITEYALKRIVTILHEVAGATVASKVEDFYPAEVTPAVIELNTNWLNSFCGTNIPQEEIIDILDRLDIELKSKSGDNITVTVPPFRSEVLRPVDLAEEVLRIYGFNKVVIPKRLSMTPSIEDAFQVRKFREKVANYLSSHGFNETMSNSQTKKSDRVGEDFVELLNPLGAEQSIMRTDMLDGIMTSVAYNINRKNKNLQFYEFGKTYRKTEKGFAESNQLILATTGSSTKTNWNTASKDADIFYLKGIIEQLAEVIQIPVKKLLKACTIEKLSAKLQKEFGIKQSVYYAVINMDSVTSQAQKSKFTLQDIPVYPIVSRDLSLVIQSNVEFKSVESIAKEVAGGYFKDLELFDVYEGDRLEKNQKSYAINIKLYDNKQTMTDDRIDKIMQKMIGRFENEIQAVIRK